MKFISTVFIFVAVYVPVRFIIGKLLKEKRYGRKETKD